MDTCKLYFMLIDHHPLATFPKLMNYQYFNFRILAGYYGFNPDISFTFQAVKISLLIPHVYVLKGLKVPGMGAG